MNLFNEALIPRIKGMTYIENFITQEESNKLIKDIDKQNWCLDLKRRTQHYGYKYDYSKRKIDESLKLGNIPEFLEQIKNKVQDKVKENLDQAIINEYNTEQGITPHVDCIPCFGAVICSLSLLEDCEMTFNYSGFDRLKKDDLEVVNRANLDKNIPDITKESITLKKGSLLTLQNEARYLWQHSIPARKSNVTNRRVSVTFRRVIL